MFDLSTDAITNILSGISLIVSCTTAYFFFRDRRHARFQIENQYADSLLKWHSNVVELLLCLRFSAFDKASMDRSKALCRLSALIEHGRFFFPNIDRGDEFGEEKPPAYRGYRNLALDFLVASYNLLEQEPNEEEQIQAEALQRHFTSVVYELIRPHGRLETVRDLTDRYFAQQKIFEDFLDDENPTVIEHIWRDRRKRA
jgi:hypothetical protein